MNHPELDNLAAALKRRFDDSVEALDGETRSRIRRARAAALDRPGRATAWWMPAGAAAMTACLAIAVYSLLPRTAPDEEAFMDEVEIISDLEFYENLDFYEWLERHELPS